MSGGQIAWPDRAGDTGLAEAREHFLAAEPIDAGRVREVILASWWRSRRWDVAAGHGELPRVRDPGRHTLLARGALPVLRNLHENLGDQPISVILADARGVVLSRLTADRDLERHLDGAHLAAGFSYAEEFAGTNAIGTALESGQAAQVSGHEHYAERLEDLACAAALIHHPTSGKTLGAVGLTCWRKDGGPLLVTLAQSTADQITHALLTSSGEREVQLLQEYLRACRHAGGIVFALTGDLVMMNGYARDALDPGDQAAVLGHASEALAGGHLDPVDVELPTGARALMYCRPLRGPGQQGAAAGVVHVKLAELPGTLEPGSRPKARRFLPGLIGAGPLWLRGCDEVDAAYASGEWLAVKGEPGTGKLSLLRAVCARRNPAGAFHVLDAATPGDHDWLARALSELLEGEGSLVIRHADRLSTQRLRALWLALEQTLAAGRQKELWVAVTISRSPLNTDMASLLQFFPGTVELPPLRQHIEDMHELVPFFLARLSHSGSLACSPEAMQLLLRSGWPGNIEQLRQVLTTVASHRRAGTIRPGDLPPECWTVSRRLLSPLESMERDAIVQSLLDYQGNKLQAAGSLGMSRATIYRKIHEYGIVTPARPHDITPQLEPRHAAGAEHARWVTAALMGMLAGQLARPGPPAGALTHAFRALAG
jgi:transcriptional regulator of acetoin/glycerol metabolism